jgi:hypothetical protein
MFLSMSPAMGLSCTAQTRITDPPFWDALLLADFYHV